MIIQWSLTCKSFVIKIRRILKNVKENKIFIKHLHKFAVNGSCLMFRFRNKPSINLIKYIRSYTNRLQYFLIFIENNDSRQYLFKTEYPNYPISNNIQMFSGWYLNLNLVGGGGPGGDLTHLRTVMSGFIFIVRG